MSELPTRDESKNGIWTTAYLTMTVAPIVRAYADGDLLTREEAANAMMAFLDQHGGDVGQHWPTIEDALAWLAADDE